MYVAIHEPFKSGCTYLVTIIITPVTLTRNERMAMMNILLHMLFLFVADGMWIVVIETGGAENLKPI